MKMYASCPICGYKLCKGESGSDVDILCDFIKDATNVYRTKDYIVKQVIGIHKKAHGIQSRRLIQKNTPARGGVCFVIPVFFL